LHQLCGHWQQEGITGSKRYHWWSLPAARDITAGHYRQQEITAGHYRQQEISVVGITGSKRSLLGITGSKRYHWWTLTQKVIFAVNMTGLLKTSIQYVSQCTNSGHRSSVQELWPKKMVHLKL
jgi:hypothetical protein